MEELKEQSNSRPWLFKKGQSGNPMGRPPGRSLKDRAKAYLAGLTDDEAEEYFAGMDKRDVWEMAEGKAEAKADLYIKELPQPILGGITNEIHRNHSVTEDTSPEKAS